MERAFDFLGRNKWLSQVGAVFVSFWAMSAVGAVQGWLILALAILSIAVSRFGTLWPYLTGKQRAMTLPGMVIGYIGVGIFIVFIAIALTALREEANRP